MVPVKESSFLRRSYTSKATVLFFHTDQKLLNFKIISLLNKFVLSLVFKEQLVTLVENLQNLFQIFH